MGRYLTRPSGGGSWVRVAALWAALAAGPALAAERAAKVELLEGTAQAVSQEGVARPLTTGSALFAGDTVRTGDRSRIDIAFADNSRFQLAANAEMTVERFAFEPATREGFFESKVLKGTFRFVTGLVAKKKPAAMTVKTAVATIGIRGTHVLGEATPDSATIILMEPEGEALASAIEVSNPYGSVVIDQPGYGTEIPDAHSPPSPPRRMKLQTIQNLMRSIQTIQRLNLPRPMPNVH